MAKMNEQHAAFTVYLTGNSYPLTPSSSLSSKRRTNIATLASMPLSDFTIMATDVYEEMQRREAGTQEFLENQDGLNTMKNASRRDLSCIPSSGFLRLVGDVRGQIALKFPEVLHQGLRLSMNHEVYERLDERYGLPLVSPIFGIREKRRAKRLSDFFEFVEPLADPMEDIKEEVAMRRVSRDSFISVESPVRIYSSNIGTEPPKRV
jgi:hypothetical protein